LVYSLVKINWRKTIFNMADGILTPCNVACGSGIVTVNSPSGSTLRWYTWLCDDMPLNSPKRPPYWNSTSGFDFDHFTAVDMSLCTSLRNFIQIGPPYAEKNDVMSIFKMADLSHLGFYGSNNVFFEKPNYITSYRSTRHHSSKLLSFWENRVFFAFWWQTDRLTNTCIGDDTEAAARQRPNCIKKY